MKNFGVFDWIVAVVTVILFIFSWFVFKHALSAFTFVLGGVGTGWILKTIFVEPKVPVIPTPTAAK
jgi:hypothetical protein